MSWASKNCGKMRVNEDRCAVIVRGGGDYAAVGKFFLPCCEKARDALEIFVSAEQHKRSHVRGVLRIAGRQERQPARKTERNHSNRACAEPSLEPCGRCADCGYRSGVHVIVGERGEHWRQDREPAGGEGAGKIYESRIVDSEMMNPGQDHHAVRFCDANRRYNRPGTGPSFVAIVTSSTDTAFDSNRRSGPLACGSTKCVKSA